MGSGDHSLCLPLGSLGPRVFCFLDFVLRELEGESSGGYMFACVIFHVSTCVQECMCLHICGGVCMCEWCLWVEGSKSVPVQSCSLHTGMVSFPLMCL